jgi:hypothetical protein
MPRLASDLQSPISASQVAWITGIHYHTRPINCLKIFSTYVGHDMQRFCKLARHIKNRMLYSPEKPTLQEISDKKKFKTTPNVMLSN